MRLWKRLGEILVQAEKGVATELRPVLIGNRAKRQGLRQTRSRSSGINLNGWPRRDSDLPRRQSQRPEQQHATEEQESQRDHQKEAAGTSPTSSSLHFTEHKVVFYNRLL